MGTVYLARLPPERCCMVVDISNGCIIRTNALCDDLFETCPLAQRDVRQLICEDDRAGFSECLLHLSLRGFGFLAEPQKVGILADGENKVVHTLFSGERLERT